MQLQNLPVSSRDLMTQLSEILAIARRTTGPILIYGPTASGKSALALRLAEAVDGCIVNADASQVWSNWQVLTARPGPEDLAQAPHRLYGHLPFHAPYSAGHWLREVRPLLHAGPRPILVGGTGLYFKALTEGLVEIPEIPAEIRAEADARRAECGHECLLADLDQQTLARIDRANPMRVQRAWEVQRTTGQGLAAWQDATPPPVLPLNETLPIHVAAPKDWLTPQISLRFEQMLHLGALDEVAANLPFWDPAHLSMKVIGASDLRAHLIGETSLESAVKRAVIATRQYAKRQRTWGRARMAGWRVWDPRDGT